MAIAPLNKTSKAEDDIALAIQYLGERNPDAAWAFCLELDHIFDLIAAFPEWFPRQRHTKDPFYEKVRFAVIRRFDYLVFYQYEAGRVLILRIFHGSRVQL